MLGLETLDFFDIVERYHTFQNPTSEEKLDRLVEYCAIADGQRVLDVGCGKAWLLRRMARAHAIEATGIELRKDWVDEAKAAIAGAELAGRIEFFNGPAADFEHAPGGFDVALCIGASFAIGSLEELLAWLKPFVRPGGVLAVGDIYARRLPVPEQTAGHFSGGAHRTLVDTVGLMDTGGLSLVGFIDSSLDDWDRYESLHWYAADEWLRENPDHPERDQFAKVSQRFKDDHLRHDRAALGWAMFVSRVNG